MLWAFMLDNGLELFGPYYRNLTMWAENLLKAQNSGPTNLSIEYSSRSVEGVCWSGWF